MFEYFLKPVTETKRNMTLEGERENKEELRVKVKKNCSKDLNTEELKNANVCLTLVYSNFTCRSALS